MMVKDFIAIKDFDCPWCSRIEIATVLAGNTNVDLLFASSGDPRVNELGKQVSVTYEALPIGIYRGKLLNFSRDILFMALLFVDE
ncbi:MAG: hypothetical protein J7K47_02395 [Thermoplasmata archaeon]|nr:hypothetical protein [Thermoplasmata archaeon]